MEAFNRWNEVKKITQTDVVIRSFKERDIFYAKVGHNIGFEQNGKGVEFLRPIIVLKKLSNNLFVGVPTSSVIKEGTFYFYFEFVEKGVKTEKVAKDIAILAQVKVFSSKRLLNKIGVMEKEDFEKMKKELGKLIF